MNAFVNAANINKMWGIHGLDGSDEEVREVVRVVTATSKYVAKCVKHAYKITIGS